MFFFLSIVSCMLYYKTFHMLEKVGSKNILQDTKHGLLLCGYSYLFIYQTARGRLLRLFGHREIVMHMVTHMVTWFLIFSFQ